MQEKTCISYPYEHLVQLNRAHNQNFFLRGFSHSFRNPINSILLATELLHSYVEEISRQLAEQDGASSDPLMACLEADSLALETMPQVIQDIHTSAVRLNRFVAYLSEMSGRGAISAGHEVDLNLLATACSELIQHQIRERTNHFSQEIEDKLPFLPGNGQQILQAMHNLLFNALLSLPDRSCAVQLRVTHHQADHQIRIQVSDQGCGISSEIMPRITDAFFTTWADRGCAGLGLTVAEQIITSHGGTLSIDSQPGKGTTVLIALPVPDSAGTTSENCRP